MPKRSLSARSRTRAIASLALALFACSFVNRASAQPLPEADVPPALRPWIPWALEANLSSATILSPLVIGATLLVMATRSWGWCRVEIEGMRAVVRSGGRTHTSDLADVRFGGAAPHVTMRATTRIALSDDDVSRLLPTLIAAYRAHLRALAAETRS
jgi:hypothetical protein